MIIRRTAAIGDVVCATTVADRLIAMGYEVIFQTHPNIHCVLRRHPTLKGVEVPGNYAHIDLDGAYENDPNRRTKHFHQMFFERAADQLRARGIDLGQPLNCKPTLTVRKVDRESWMGSFSKFDRPWIFICPRSDNYNVRQVPDGVWAQAAPKINGTKFWLGRHPAPPGIIDLQAKHFDNVIDWISLADVLVTVDTGPMHVAAALGTPVVAIGQSSSPELHLNDQNDFVTIGPQLDCLNCQLNVCPKNYHSPPCQQVPPNLIAAWVNARAQSIYGNSISAVIPIYRPPADRLNRCLEAVLPQVNEIVVTRDANGQIPEGAMTHRKISYIRHWRSDIGYGRNVNFGARHTNGHWLWLLNDDCFVKPDAAARLMECAKPGVGLIGHLLRYPNGTIQHGGKFRTPGMRGWGHIDQNLHIHSINAPIETENVTGASILVNRKAFYDVSGNDENFFFYSVDDDMCMSMRQKGYKIIYTPHAEAIHEEAATSRQNPRIGDWVRQGNAAFDRKWRWWIDRNINTIPGTF